MATIDARTKLFVSLAARASSNGVYFYNLLFASLGINAVYLSAPTPTLSNLRASLELLGVKGAAIAAPFKNEVISTLDVLTDVAQLTGSVNSIRLTEQGQWEGHNTDEAGLCQILAQRWSPVTRQPVVMILGSGGVVPSVISALQHVQPTCRILLQARNAIAAQRLANQWNIELVPSETVQPCDLFINATPIAQTDASRLLQLSKHAKVVFDLQPVQQQHFFEMHARERGQFVLRGMDFYLAQFAQQFLFFTGILPDIGQLEDLAAKRAT